MVKNIFLLGAGVGYLLILLIDFNIICDFLIMMNLEALHALGFTQHMIMVSNVIEVSVATLKTTMFLFFLTHISPHLVYWALGRVAPAWFASDYEFIHITVRALSVSLTIVFLILGQKVGILIGMSNINPEIYSQGILLGFIVYLAIVLLHLAFMKKKSFS